MRSILEDSTGTFWFGSWQEGVARFDGKRLTYFTVDDGLSHDQVRSIHEDRERGIWFETGVGVSRYDGTRIATHFDRDHTSKDAWQLRPGDLWFKGDEPVGFNEREGRPGVYRFDGRTFTYLAIPPLEDREDDGYASVTGIGRGRNGRLWIATYGAVIGYDGASFTVIDNESLGLDEETGWLHVRCVFEDSRGRLWIGNNGIGVLLHDGERTIDFTRKNGLGRRDHRSGRLPGRRPGDASEGAPSLHRVFSIGEDRDGNIWFGTMEQGAWRFDGASLRNFTAKEGLTSDGILAIYRDRRGDLWLAGDGVFRFNGASFERIH